MKQIIFLTITIICLIIIANLLKSIYEIYHSKDTLLRTQQELQQVKAENEKLKTTLSQVSNQDFVERQARDKLFMLKPGESTLILPSTASSKEQGRAQTDVRPNWQQWLGLFF